MAALSMARFRAQPSKSPVGPIAFEDFDSLEAGHSHEFVSPALLTPSPVPTPRRSHWVPCRITRPRKDRFELRAEDGAFMLCARVVGAVCYVSTDEGFVSTTQLPPPKHYADARAAAQAAPKNAVAVVAPREGRNKAPIFELILVSAKRDKTRRPLCAVQPSSVWCDRQGAELRRLAITLPESAPTAHYTHDWNTPLPTAKSVALHSKLPVWNRQLGCLSLHFGRKRVRASSSKNFLVYTADALRDPKKRDDAEAAVFQLGKLAPKTFALDFRHPVSALQAFAVALAAFRVKHSRGVPRISRAEAESN